MDISPSDLALTFGLLFLPQAVLAIFSSLNLRSKSSLEKIITRHPSILLLPVFTFFTFSKLNVSCSGGESRVMFSKKFSWINIGVSAVGYVLWSVWYLNRFGWLFPAIISGPAFVLSVPLTVLFLHLDRLCSCCSCCLEPGEEISVYDPHTDQRLLLRDGQMVEPPEEDLEAGHTSSSRCCCAGSDSESEDIPVEVICKQDDEERV